MKSQCQAEPLETIYFSQLRNWGRKCLNKAIPLCSVLLNICCNPFLHPELHWNVLFNLIQSVIYNYSLIIYGLWLNLD